MDVITGYCWPHDLHVAGHVTHHSLTSTVMMASPTSGRLNGTTLPNRPVCVCVCVCLREYVVKVGEPLVSRPWSTEFLLRLLFDAIHMLPVLHHTLVYFNAHIYVHMHI